MKSSEFISDLKNEFLTEQNDWKNTLVILIDGICFQKVQKFLPTSFLETCLPSSTVPATTLIRTGLVPEQSGLFAWSQYYQETDEIVEVFSNTNIQTKKQSKLTIKPLDTIETIVEQIKQKTAYKAYEIMPNFQTTETLEAWGKRILESVFEPSDKYVYAYWYHLDSIAHQYGVQSENYQTHLSEIVDFLQSLIKKMPKNSRIFIISDHGLIDTQPLFIDDYPLLKKMLTHPIFLEPRFVGFKVKEENKEDFQKHFSIPGFSLIPSTNIKTGDFIAVANGKYALYQRDFEKSNKAEHGGITPDETLIPFLKIEV